MHILVLGGTRFVGRHIVEAALGRGHEVTLFNRGRHPHPFEGVRTLTGDRDGDLAAVREGRWDRVIDVSGYTAPQVARSLDALEGRHDGYTFISTTSVYRKPARPGIDEAGQLKPADHGDDGGYGESKVACEEVLRERLDDAVLIARPGIIAGPHDYTDRLAYWCLRVREGGEMLAPGRPDQPVQVIDVRDLAAWIVEAGEAERTGTFNLVGPGEPLTMGGLLETVARAIGSRPDLRWIDDDALAGAGVEPGYDLPFWLPGDHAWFFTVSADRARAAGLRHRPLEATVRDTLEWIGGRGLDDLDAGISAARERELLRSAGTG
jgi:2'-hydroxyisoflavone reductase